jgi:hypothetical protein
VSGWVGVNLDLLHGLISQAMISNDGYVVGCRGAPTWVAGKCRGTARQSPESVLGAVHVWSCDERNASRPPTLHRGFTPGQVVRIAFKVGNR